MKRHLTLTLLGCAALVAAGANANTITFVTPPGSTTSGPVDASATFTTSANTLTIVLTDLQANPTDVAQLISDISWGFSRTTISSSGISLSMQSGAGIDIGSGGTTSADTVPSNAWQLGTGFHITALGGGQPKGLIIGPGPYSNANGSIAANGPHNPFYNQTATFTLNIPGLSVDDRVNSAIFSFGTTAGIDVTGVPGTVPDGGTTVLLLGSALSGLGLLRRKLS